MRIEDLKGFIDFPGGFQLLNGQPIDSRYVGEDLEFLQSVIEIGAAYPGLKIFIKSENKSYTYKKDSDGEYKFQLETVSFTDEEEAALSSGITKDKVDKFEKKYDLPVGGITESDLSDQVKSKLKKAESAITSESDPTVPAWAKQPSKPKYSVKEIDGLEEQLAGKVESKPDMGLSHEDFTNEEKVKLRGVEEGAQVNLVEDIYLNGQQQQRSGKRVNIALKTVNGEPIVGPGDLPIKTVNGKPIVGQGDLGVVSTDGDQNVGGSKTFQKDISVPSKVDIDLQNPRSKAVATEAQVASAIGKLGTPLTSDSPLNAGKLYGNLPANLAFPQLNQDTTGNAASASRLKYSKSFSIAGKVISQKVSFDGQSDVVLEVDSLSQNPSDYPVFNQDTTGNAGSASRLKNTRKLKVNLSNSSGQASFDGSSDLEEIPVKGRLQSNNLFQGSGSGTRRRVLSTNTSVDLGDLSLQELTPNDVGLDKVLNVEQATKADLESLKAKVENLEKMGSFVGSYGTYEDLPKTTGGILGKYGVEATVNDFVTVRGGEYPVSSGIKDGSATCWSITNIDSSGFITWAYEYTYDFDLMGKIDKVSGSNIEGCLPQLTADGGISSSGRRITDFLLSGEVIPGSDLTLRQKILNSLTSEGIIYGARKLIHPDTTDPCNHGNSYTPVYIEDGTPVTCSRVAAIDEEGKVMGLDGAGDPKVELSIDHSVSSDIAKKSQFLVDEEGRPRVLGGNKQPIYLDSEGRPAVIEKALGEMAFKDIIDTEIGDTLFTEEDEEYDWEEGTLKVHFCKNYTEGGNVGSDEYKIQFIRDSENVPSWYGLIIPSADSADGSGFKKEDLLSSMVENLGIPKDRVRLLQGSDGIYNIGSDLHNIKSSFIKVKVFEIRGDFGSSNRDLSPDSIMFSENTGMAEVSLSRNVVIYTSADPYYNSVDGISQGIYLVEISK